MYNYKAIAAQLAQNEGEREFLELYSQCLQITPLTLREEVLSDVNALAQGSNMT